MDIRKLRVAIGEKVYQVTVEILGEGSATTPPPAHPVKTISSVSVQAPQSSASPAPSSAADQLGEVLSPMSGKVVGISVKVGDTVSEGDQVASVEAMKMNTYVFAARSGRVEAVFVQVGDAVEDGKLLLRIQ